MAKKSTQYVCQECGTPHMKWGGQCTGCSAWNTLVEEIAEKSSPFTAGKSAKSKASAIDYVNLKGAEKPLPRRLSGIAEFDRVCGGGLVPGCAMLIGGDPGIGKSTLLLQALAALSKNYACS